MDQKSFDQLTRLISSAETRRAALRFVVGSFLGGALVEDHADAAALDARSKRKRRGGNKNGRNDKAGPADNKRNDRRQGARQSDGGPGTADHGNRLASEGKGGKGRKGKSKGKGKKKDCARAGQSPKRDRPCCTGLVRDAVGLCNQPSPPPDPCAPNCDDKACGPDGCGGFCPPGCPSTASICSPEGQCVGCVADNDCPDPGPCKIKKCLNGTCSPLIEQDGSNPGNRCTGNKICCNGACKDCCNDGHCPDPQGGTGTCSQGICHKLCANNLHRLCGPNRDVCQECCSEQQCSTIHERSTCVGGTCKCPDDLTRCGMECVNTNFDPNHCGACGTKCPSGTCNNRQCQTDSCDLSCAPRATNCEPLECPGDKICSSRLATGTCSCTPGWVDCDADGSCESCGDCGVTSCPAEPDGTPGKCCPGGFCSCGGSCEAACDVCWLTPTGRDQEGTSTSYQEQCGSPGGCVECWGRCCTACINGECASSGPIGGGTIRRR